MADWANTNIAWNQLHDAYGSAGDIGELLARLGAGKDVWGDLIGRVLHQGTLYEATPPVLSWILHAIESGKLAGRPFAVGKPFGTTEVLSGGSLAFSFMSVAAASAAAALENP